MFGEYVTTLQARVVSLSRLRLTADMSYKFMANVNLVWSAVGASG
jgi:hypothetical protein